MVLAIARKEFTAALLTYRFAVGLILCVVAVAAGTLAVIEDYAARRAAYQKAVQAYADEVLEQEGALAALVFDLKAFRAPRQLGVFSVGSDRWQGNAVTATHHEVPRQSAWLGTANPYMVVFRTIDVTLVVQIVMGLLALLFAHDAIAGEREEGTLRLMLANPVARDQVLFGKALGHIALLTLILAVTFVVALLFVQVSPALQLGGDEVARVAAMFAVSVLYASAMYCAGLLLSTWTRRSATALVLAVFAWLLGVAVYPNAVSFGVDTISPVRQAVVAAAELQSQIDESFSGWLRQRTKEQTGSEWGVSLGAYSSSSNWNNPRGFWYGGFRLQEQVDQMRQWALERGVPPPAEGPQSEAEIQQAVAELAPYFAEVEGQRIAYADRIWREAWEPVEETMRQVHALAVGLSLLSPAGAYARATAALARTDRGDYWRFLDAARRYRVDLIAFYEQEGWFGRRAWFNDQGEKGTLDTLPRFQERAEGLGDSARNAAVPLAVLAAFTLASFLGAHWRFRRCDLTG